VRELAAAVPAASVRAWRALPAGESDRAFGGFAVERMLATQRTDLERFGVRFSRWFRESELHASGAVQTTLEELQARGHVYETDGARFFRSTTWGDDKDRVLVRSGGAPTYFLADAAYHRDKHERGFTRVIDVWGPDHHGHIPRMQAVARALDYPEDWLEVVIIQWVKLLQRGEALKMSKREGRLVTLADLMSELGPSGPDVAKFFFLMRQQSSHLDFDLDLARQQSDENPVFYVKYAHARICSVVAKAAEAGLRLEVLETGGALPPDVALERLTTAEELDLVQRLADFAGLVARAAAAREPHRLTNYCEETARAFHQFYHHHRVVQDDLELGRARLALCHATRRVLASALDLMAISAPQSM
jgi:arginyl-tRNA synthetase